MVTGVRPSLMLLLGAALLVMLAAAVSVSGLVLARAVARAPEMHLRTALGAGRGRIVRQLAIEALTIAIPGAALGLILGSWAVTFFDATMPASFRSTLPFAERFTLSFPAAAASVAVTMAVVLVAGLIPALRASRPDNPFTTGARATAGRAETRLRGVVVAAQIALAVVLLAGAALVGRSVVKLSHVNPGFAIDGLLTGRLSLPDTAWGAQCCSRWPPAVLRWRRCSGSCRPERRTARARRSCQGGSRAFQPPHDHVERSTPSEEGCQ
jgi:putative ABC transport system permease protein